RAELDPLRAGRERREPGPALPAAVRLLDAPQTIEEVIHHPERIEADVLGEPRHRPDLAPPNVCTRGACDRGHDEPDLHGALSRCHSGLSSLLSVHMIRTCPASQSGMVVLVAFSVVPPRRLVDSA